MNYDTLRQVTSQEFYFFLQNKEGDLKGVLEF